MNELARISPPSPAPPPYPWNGWDSKPQRYPPDPFGAHRRRKCLGKFPVFLSLFRLTWVPWVSWGSFSPFGALQGPRKNLWMVFLSQRNPRSWYFGSLLLSSSMPNQHKPPGYPACTSQARLTKASNPATIDSQQFPFSTHRVCTAMMVFFIPPKFLPNFSRCFFLKYFFPWSTDSSFHLFRGGVGHKKRPVSWQSFFNFFPYFQNWFLRIFLLLNVIVDTIFPMKISFPYQGKRVHQDRFFIWSPSGLSSPMTTKSLMRHGWLPMFST